MPLSRRTTSLLAGWLAVSACTTAPTPSTVPTGSGTPLPSATGAVGAITVEWRQVELPIALGPEISISGPVTGGSGAIALVGQQGEARPTLLSSPDGIRWQASLVDDGAFTGGLPDPLFAVPGGFVAIAREGTLHAAPYLEQLRAWLSRDGRSWTRGGVLRGLINVQLHAADGDTVVACGQGEQEDHALRCLRSVDGAASWSLVADPTGELRRAERVDDLIAGLPGFLAAGELEGRLRIWRSGDGDHWTLLPPDERLTETSAEGLLRGRAGLVLSGAVVERDRRHGDRRHGVLWFSTNGSTWERLPLPDVDTTGGFVLVGLGDAYVGIAVHAFFNDARASGVLTSVDGRHWRDDPLPEVLAGEPPQLVALGDRLLALKFADDGSLRLVLGILSTVADPAPFPSPTPAPTAPPPVPSEGPVPAVAWRQLPHLGPGELRGVTVGGPGYVAVGRDGSGAAVWTSIDGEDWTRVPDSPAFRLGSMETVATGGPGLVAAGFAYRPNAAPEQAKIAAFWSSRDGISWERAPHNADLEIGGDIIDGPEVGIRSIAAGGPGALAVGATDRGGAVWTSPDGIDWRLGARLQDGFPTEVAAGGPGLVAVGETGPPWAPRAAVWTSRDGISWARLQPDLDGQALRAVTVRGITLVALGEGPAAWTSGDGTDWLWAPDQPGLGEGSPADVAASAVGIVAVGSRPCPGRESTCPTAWLSSGGLAWTQTPATVELGTGWMNGVAAGGWAFIAVGASGNPDEPMGAVWVGLPGS